MPILVGSKQKAVGSKGKSSKSIQFAFTTLESRFSTHHASRKRIKMHITI